MREAIQDLQRGSFMHSTIPSDLSIYYYMAKNMEPSQLMGIAERKARHILIPKLPIDYDRAYEGRIPNTINASPRIIERNSELLRKSLRFSERERYRTLLDDAINGEFTFLNRNIEFKEGIDWNHELLDQFPILWRLKLHSFEFLEWAVMGFDNAKIRPTIHKKFQEWLLSWTAENPIGTPGYLRKSWIPHSVSLRILNWSRYAAWCENAGIPVKDFLYRQIYKNALFLENHIESDVGGNHLIENAIAILVAGFLFKAHQTKWISKGLDILEKEGNLQFLADGSHFERSTMYHIMVLRRYTTAYNLLSYKGCPTSSIKNTAEQALGYLEKISEPDGKIPLVNDSVFGETISSNSCIEYCNQSGLRAVDINLNHPKGSGYRKLITDGSELIIDVGDHGPAHLPGHSHNDHLSVLLWVNGSQVLTDTGVFDYASDSRRQYSRSVRAHNTAQFKDTEPTPISGSYLMGKRASINVDDDYDDGIKASSRRQTVFGPNYEHKRSVSSTDSVWDITDTVQADTDGEFTIRYHFGLSIDISRKNKYEDSYLIHEEGDKLAELEIIGANQVEHSTSPYFHQYGKSDPRDLISASTNNGNTIETRITTCSE